MTTYFEVLKVCTVHYYICQILLFLHRPIIRYFDLKIFMFVEGNILHI
jgi:hypothetical protein